MDLRLSDDLEALRKTVEAFAHDEVAPTIGDYYVRGEFPLPLVETMAEMGLFGLPFPEEYGGMGGDYVALCVAIEELAKVDSSIAITLEAGVSLGAMPIYRFGSEELKQQWLPKLTSGQLLGAFGLTEPGAGSDAGGTATTAVLEDGHWVINGSKAFITNSGTAITGLITVTAVTGYDADGRKEISAILIPAGTPGLTVAPPYKKVGWDASDTHELAFDNVRVPAGNLVGERGRGYAQFLRILDEGRIAIAALAAIAYLAAHQWLYGGWTVYAAGDHFVGDGEFSVVGTQADPVGRTRRLVGLLVDRQFGIAAWSPLWLVLPFAVVHWLRRHRGYPTTVVAAVVGVAWLNATFVALTMHGWWVPGRQLVVALPAALILVAGWVEADVRRRLPLAAALGLLGAVNWLWLAFEASTERRTLIVDFADTASWPYRLVQGLLPDGIAGGASNDLLLLTWTLLLAAAVAFSEHRRAAC